MTQTNRFQITRTRYWLILMASLALSMFAGALLDHQPNPWNGTALVQGLMISGLIAWIALVVANVLLRISDTGNWWWALLVFLPEGFGVLLIGLVPSAGEPFWPNVVKWRRREPWSKIKNP